MASDRIVEVQCADYEHTLDLAGVYDGVTITPKRQTTPVMFAQALHHQPFEFLEFSIANYIMLRAQGARWLSAIPVFPYRAFRHNIIYVLPGSKLTAPQDLRGRKVGLPDYSMTAAVWTRGIYKSDYGVLPEDIVWVSKPKQRFDTPEGITLIRREEDLEDLLVRGEIDALLATALSAKARQDGRFRRLLPGHPRDERAYYDRTGIYPPNHVMVANREVVKDFDAVAPAVFSAFAASKARAYSRKLGGTLLPWGGHYWDEMFAAFHGDPMPYGLTDLARRTIGTMSGYLADQKLIDKAPSVDDLFDPSVRALTEGPATGAPAA